MVKSRELTGKELRQVRDLIHSLCATYNEYYNCCPKLNDYGCYQLTRRFTDSGMCRYFRESVLPLNAALEAVFFPKATKPCKICGERFVPEKGRVYCSDKCRAEGNRAASAKRMKRYRQKQG